MAKSVSAPDHNGLASVADGHLPGPDHLLPMPLVPALLLGSLLFAAGLPFPEGPLPLFPLFSADAQLGVVPGTVPLVVP